MSENITNNPSVPTQIVSEVKFPRFINNLGIIPTSYKDSMSYYETLAWLCKYLEETVIPTVNQNGEATQELQALYIQLKDYVEHYFDNLDVQEEINNKLDVMAGDGTLANIINNVIFDGLNDKVDFLYSDKTLVIGDSYALGSNPNNETLTAWPTIFKNLMQLSVDDFTLVAETGAGFLRAGNYNHTFLQLLQSKINNITDKDHYKNIIVCGGYNDNEYTLTNIRNAIITFVNYCYSQFINATVYIGCIGYRREVSQSAQTIRRNIAGAVYPAYANNVSVNLLTRPYVYLNGVENILKTLPVSYMYADNAHPNQAGQNALGQGIFQAFKTGYVDPYSSGAITLANSQATSITGNPSFKHCNNQLNIQIPSIEIKFAQETNFALTVGGLDEIATYTCNGFIGGTSNENNVIVGVASIQDYNKGRYTVPCVVMFDYAGKVRLWTWFTNNNSDTSASIQLTSIKQINIFRCQMVMPALLS